MIKLINRGVLSVKGDDVVDFLDNILTNNIDKVTEDDAVFAGLLSPQGKYLFDMFIIKYQDGYLLDCCYPIELVKRLKMYKLRSKVEIADLSEEYSVFAILPDQTYNSNSINFIDPRNDKIGRRVIAPFATKTDGDFTDYEYQRINLGLPELQIDLLRDGDFALEGLMDDLGAIDFHKGCYVGQEMTSRMKRRTTVKNKLIKFEFSTPNLEHNTPIYAGEIIIGYVRSTAKNNEKNIGLALIRTDKLESAHNDKKKIIANDTEIFISGTD